MFVRILKDAHDAGIVDLRRRGDDFEIARAAEAAPVSEQLARNDQAAAAAATPTAAPTISPRVGMGHRSARAGRPLGAPPPGLLSFGVVDEPVRGAAQPAQVGNEDGPEPAAEEGTKTPRRGRRGRVGRSAAKAAPAPSEKPAAVVEATEAGAQPAAKAKRGRAAKKGGGRGRKNAPAPAKA